MITSETWLATEIFVGHEQVLEQIIACTRLIDKCAHATFATQISENEQLI